MSDRIAKLILLLGSDQPGEVVNAAGMLVKALRKEGRDLHSLVGQLHGKAARPEPDMKLVSDYILAIAAQARVEKQLRQLRDEYNDMHGELRRVRDQRDLLQHTVNQLRADLTPGGRPKRPAAVQPDEPTENWKPDWPEQVRWAIDYGWERNLLSSKEHEFLSDMAGMTHGFRPSYKQLRWMEDIHDRLRRVWSSMR